MNVRARDVVFLSTNHWTGLPTSKQHLAAVLARSRRVLYVDPPIDVFSTLGRPRRWRKLRGLARVDERLWVLSPVALATSRDPESRLAFHRRYAPRVRRAARALGFVAPIAWSFAPEHLGYAGAIDESLLIYHAADEPAATSPDPTATGAIERDHMEAADVVLVASRALLDARAWTGKAHRLPNAADVRHFARVLAGDPEAPAERLAAAILRLRQRAARVGRVTGRPSILFGGAAYEWFDETLFLGAARARPDWDFTAAGPVGRALARARLPPNVTLLGRRPYNEFPEHVALCDVAVIPLREGEQARNCDPIVMYEYLLCGKPVVATPFPAALERRPLVRTARGLDGFVREIEEALEEIDDAPAARERMAFGYANTWEDRAETALGLIAEAAGASEDATGGGAA